MPHLKKLLLLIILLPFVFSCNNKLDVNGPWKEIPVIYCLLNQNDSVHYIKLTKAFLGEGDAMYFAQIPDSNNYPYKMDVKIEGYEGTDLRQTLVFDTVTITNKEAGDSIFYYPNQLMYFATGQLNENYTYKMTVHNPHTGKVVTAETGLVKHFDIETPKPPPGKAVFDGTTPKSAKWTSAVNGKRYQLLIRFHYKEVRNNDTLHAQYKTVDWILFNNIKSQYTKGGEEMSYSYMGESFYRNLQNNIPVDPDVYRVAGKVEYIFTVASDDLNTYMEVTEPSNSIIQERPSFTNLSEGVGIFSSRFDNTRVNPLNLDLSAGSLLELKNGVYTKDLNF